MRKPDEGNSVAVALFILVAGLAVWATIAAIAIAETGVLK